MDSRKIWDLHTKYYIPIKKLGKLSLTRKGITMVGTGFHEGLCRHCRRDMKTLRFREELVPNGSFVEFLCWLSAQVVLLYLLRGYRLDEIFDKYKEELINTARLFRMKPEDLMTEELIADSKKAYGQIQHQLTEKKKGG